MAEIFSFGEWVRKRRRALDLTQDELAQQIGCAVSMVRKIELDERRPSKQLAALLADGLQLPVSERDAFLKAARAEGAVDHLVAPPIMPASRSQAESAVQTKPKHLPAPTTTLIGRAHDLAQLHAIAARPNVRLITLTGPGGTGKTRLALQFATESADSYIDGVVFVDLAPLTDGDHVVATIAQVLGVRELVGTTLMDRLREYLQSRRLLLLLDNFEHVLGAVPTVAELLRSAPTLTILVTSRVVLRLSGEHEYLVPPLEVPPTGVASAHYPAVQLFVERARAIQPAFNLIDENSTAVAEICRRLDGLPLAIELAAARIKLFRADALLARLNDRLRLLTSGARDLPTRQQTLRTTIDWSYELLAPAEQRLFVRLAVFVGGWILEAAEAICASAGDLRIDVIDGLQTLVDHSLVRQQTGPDGVPRFRRLETIGEYASELLVSSGEEQALRLRHAEYFCALAEEVETFQDGPLGMLWLDKLDADRDNIHTAFITASGVGGDPRIAIRLIGAMSYFLLNRQTFSEALEWIDIALNIANDSILPAIQAKALNTAGVVAVFMGAPLRAEPLLLQALKLYELLADPRGCSEVLNHLGLAKAGAGQLAEALAYQLASVQQAQYAESDIRLAWALAAVGHMQLLLGRYDVATTAIEDAIAMGVLQGTSHQTLCVMLAQVLIHAGDDIRAITLLDDAMPNMRGEGPLFIAAMFTLRAQLARACGDDASATVWLNKSLELASEQGAAIQLAHTHYELSLLALSQGKLIHSRKHMHQGFALYRAQHNPWFISVSLLGVGLTDLLQDDRPSAVQHYTESLTLIEVWRENMLAREAALLVAISGLLLARETETIVAAIQATRLWGAIAAIEPRTAGKRVTPPFLSLPLPEKALRDAAIVQARILLGDEAFDAAWAAGQVLTLDEAVAEALAFTTSTTI